MKIVVIGGSGLIGSKLVTNLRAHGHEAVPASLESGVNTLTGEGLAAVLEGAEVVVDVSNSPSFEEKAVMEFFQTSTGNLLKYEARAGVRHHIALSVVGTERLQESAYLRAKSVQEKLIAGSGIPYSIVHSTQFFEFVGRIARDATDGKTVRIPPVLFQPIAADDVAAAMATVAEGRPSNGVVEIGGPEQFRFDDLVRAALRAGNDEREVLADPHARYFGAELGERSLVPGDSAQLGKLRFSEWLERKKHMQEHPFDGVGGLRIYSRSWHPDGKPRGVVVIVHGLNAHSGQYVWVAEELARNGLAVYALDLRGHGKSAGERFWVDKMADYVEDVAKLVRMAKQEVPDVPAFVLGHSAGGVVSTMYALEHQDEIAGLICEDAAFALPGPNALIFGLFKALDRIAPHTRLLHLDNKRFSRDPSVVRSLEEDPMIDGERQPNHTIAELIFADERLARESSNVQLPLLVLHGKEDKVTSPKGSERFYDKAGSKDKTLKLYDGGYHDLLNDIDKKVVLADIQTWLDAHIPQAA